MQTNRKTLGIIIIVVGLILLFLIIYFVFFRQSSAPTAATTATTTGTGQLTPSGPQNGTTTPGDKPRNNHQTYDISKEAPHKLNADDLAQRGKAFAELLGTYSNYANYSNFTDSKIFVTASFRQWVDKYVAEQKAGAKAGAYSGITTTALTTEVKNFDDSAGTAQIVITTRRAASTDKIGGGTPYTQKLDLNFLKVKDEWLIDQAYWEK